LAITSTQASLGGISLVGAGRANLENGLEVPMRQEIEFASRGLSGAGPHSANS
jgi:hypothetical protein